MGHMKTKTVDGREVLDGTQTFKVFQESAFGEFKEYVTIQDGVPVQEAEAELQEALEAMQNTCVTEGWRRT